MKRGLVEYPSADEDAPVSGQPTKKKKRKLPALSPSLTVPTPEDNPALHQGRLRTVPHVDGQYATYIYVPLVLDRNDALCTLVEDVLSFANERVSALHAIGRQAHGGASARWEMHISLSRPLFLRAHQREEFKRAVRQVASSIAPFDASFTTFSELTNDERTRSFLALEVGAGHVELRRCLDLLTPTLRLLRHREFYADPKFHASVAWALLETTASPSNIASLSTAGELDETIWREAATPGDDHARSASPRVVEQSPDSFHRIPHFPHTLIPSLNQAYAAKLSQARTGGFVIDKISAKIGKDAFTWPLNGAK